eukprot:gb/GECH01007146.1/.p1 GENE.gb/GECH01007146.1/~~gb/GECH01007146.1/.p1  ORF type:complete len:105 (+),score=21.05 gb/GECH01007146.1/:1-315(+)
MDSEECKTKLEQVKKNDASLRDLILMEANIDSHYTKHFSEALQSNTWLRSINFNVNDIEDEGVKYLSSALKTNRSLTELALDRKQQYYYKIIFIILTIDFFFTN